MKKSLKKFEDRGNVEFTTRAKKQLDGYLSLPIRTVVYEKQLDECKSWKWIEKETSLQPNGQRVLNKTKNGRSRRHLTVIHFDMVKLQMRMEGCETSDIRIKHLEFGGDQKIVLADGIEHIKSLNHLAEQYGSDEEADAGGEPVVDEEKEEENEHPPLDERTLVSTFSSGHPIANFVNFKLLRAILHHTREPWGSCNSKQAPHPE